MTESNRKCERCDAPIPADYGNDLCDACYAIVSVANENEAKDRPQEESPIQSAPTVLNTETPPPLAEEPAYEYKENPQAPDKDQIDANLKQFSKSGIMLHEQTRAMYTFVKNYLIKKVQSHSQYEKHIWKPLVVDVGCGSGVGSNILSMESQFVWGIDKNEKSVKFAKECFTREISGIYYTPQVTFDQVDIMDESRETMQFDIVTAIEIIEHVDDWRGFLENIIKKFNWKDNRTEYFISTPNRNHPKLRTEGPPKNAYHVREWTGQEFVENMKKYFNDVKLMNWKGEPVEPDTTHSPLLAHCKGPKI